MSNERVEELISIKALENFDVLNTKISESVTNIERLIATGVDLNKAFGASNGFKPTNEGAAKLATVEGQLKKMTEDLAKANAKLEASYSAQARSLGETKVQQQLVNKAHTDAAKEALGLVGAYDRLNKQYLDAAKNAKNMAAELGNDNEAVKEAAKYANDLQTRLKAIDANVGQFNRNVGNYAGSLGPALALLQKELQGIQAQMAGMKNTDPGFEKLAKQEQLLTSLNSNLNKGFSSTRQELRAYTEASKQLGTQLGLTNGLFVEFSDKVGDVKNELDDVQKTLNYKASDTKYLDGAISAVNGLAGVYGAAQGAAELFGDQTGELQKQFVKLQAIMTIIQSLQAVQNALQTESGAIQLGLAAKTALVNAAMTVENALFATNAAAIVTAAAAQEENAVAAEVGAVAMTEEAAATAAATTATISFRTALISTGIGALIVAIGAAIVYVASKIPDWIRGTQLTIEEQKTLAETLQKTNQALV
jgi:DNA repair exonuclease SbcCD ATPase subunit